MSISASMVRDLREKTSAGMLDCKKALEETKGDFEAAVEWLRKKGLSSAAKKADRLASEGVIVSYVANENTGVLLEVNSETDFVAKNDMFKAFVKEVVEFLAKSKQIPNDVESLLNLALPSGSKISARLQECIAKIGENLVIRRFIKFETSNYVHSYIHGDGKIGVLVELSGKADDFAKTFANDICLHVAAMNPIALSQEAVPADVVAKEKEILKAKNLEQGKKADMVDKIVEGQIRKFLAESVLLEQAFVKNPDLKIKDYQSEMSKKSSQPFTIKRYVRFELGEGLQKKSNNFAEEVAAQMKGH